MYYYNIIYLRTFRKTEKQYKKIFKQVNICTGGTPNESEDIMMCERFVSKYRLSTAIFPFGGKNGQC